MTRFVQLLAVVCLALGGLSVRVATVSAQTTRYVTVCNSDNGATPGTLRYEVAQANTANDNDTILFSCGGSATITLSTPLTITGTMTIDGTGQTIAISGGTTTRIFTVNSGHTLTLNNLTLEYGKSNDGGAIFNQGTVDASGIFFFDNSVTCVATPCSTFGGAIFNFTGGTVSVTGSQFSSNSVTCATTNCAAGGGAIANAGTMLTVTDSNFLSNQATCGTLPCLVAGGALDNATGTADISTSEVDDSTTSCSGAGCLASGGAMYNAKTATLNIAATTFFGSLVECTAAGCIDGGGAIANAHTLNITTSTFNDNETTCTTAACITAGGAIDNATGGTAGITNSTFALSRATTCSGATCHAYGGAIFNQATLSIGATIIASSTGGNCYGPIIDWGYNLEDTSPSTCGFSQANHDLVGYNPDLDALGNYGGLTQTMALQPLSPAIDYIPVGASFTVNTTTSTLCPATGGTDQRGYPRPDLNEAYCDIGAYEYQDSELPTPNSEDAYDIESSNWYCTTGGSACVPNGSVASECFNLTPCSGVNYGDAEAFGPPNGATNGVPDELVLACAHSTSTGYDIGYIDVVSSQGNTDYPNDGVYGSADTGVIGGKGTLIGGNGSENNLSQVSSINATAYDPSEGVRGSVTGTQNTDNNANRLNSGTLRVTISGNLWHVNITGSSPNFTEYSGTISCTVGGSHGYDLLTAGKDTNALAEGELENTLGDNFYLASLAPPEH